jgi:hypothetical protein
MPKKTPVPLDVSKFWSHVEALDAMLRVAITRRTFNIDLDSYGVRTRRSAARERAFLRRFAIAFRDFGILAHDAVNSEQSDLLEARAKFKEHGRAGRLAAGLRLKKMLLCQSAVRR